MLQIMTSLLATAALAGAAGNEVQERVRDAAQVFQEIMAAPDQAIPEELLESAHCIAIVPGMKKGGFVVGARYGKGVALCRQADNTGWTAPSTVRIEGGSFGLQIGGGEVDVIMLVMNDEGARKLIKSEFTLGGEVSVMGGPVGRSAKAETDALMHAQILSYSRSRGVFAGAVIEGATLRSDDDDNRELYGKPITHKEILQGKVAPPESAQELIRVLSRHSMSEK